MNTEKTHEHLLLVGITRGHTCNVALPTPMPFPSFICFLLWPGACLTAQLPGRVAAGKLTDTPEIATIIDQSGHGTGQKYRSANHVSLRFSSIQCH